MKFLPSLCISMTLFLLVRGELNEIGLPARIMPTSAGYDIGGRDIDKEILQQKLTSVRLLQIERLIENCTFPGVTNCTCYGDDTVNVTCQKMNYIRLPDVAQPPRVPAIVGILMQSNLISRLSSACLAALTNLRFLHLANNLISVIEMDAFSQLPHLESLELNGNPIISLPDFVFSPLVSLRRLNLNNVSFVPRAEPFINLTNLRILALNNNSLTAVPMFIYKNESVLPALEEFMLSKNLIQVVPWHRLHLFPKLKKLDFYDNKITVIPAGALKHLSKLIYLDLSLNKLKNGVASLAFCSKSLEELRLKKSGLHVKKTMAHMFQCIMKLRRLQTTHCSTDPNVHGLYQNLRHLSYLDISSSRIAVKQDMFLNSTNINQLGINFLSITNLQMLANLTRLVYFFMSDNKIQTINLTSLPLRVWKQLRAVDFSENPFLCDCSLTWFREWLHSQNSSLINNVHKTKCQFPTSLRLLDVKHPTRLECFTAPFDWYLCVVLLFIGCLQISSLLASCLYRFRWNIRYARFLFKAKHQQYHEPLDHHHFIYDAFVMYSPQDTSWVIHQLHPHLETTDDNLRLCIHDRDWEGGGDITDNIIQSIESSQKCLLIISNAFASSNWCHFEMSIAQTRLFEADRDNLVLVILEEMAEINMTPRLRLQMQRQTYIEWTDNEIGQLLFWARLRQALHQPDLSVINSPLPQSMFTES